MQNESDEIEFSDDERIRIDLAKKYALRELRNIKPSENNEYYEALWKVHVEQKLTKHLSVDKKIYLQENEKKDWINDLKEKIELDTGNNRAR